jgi:hypothetical protein
MLSKFLGVFFPGFSWFHGFALWDIGTALSVGGSIVGGLMGSDAAEDAADAQTAASAEAIAELRKIGERTRSDTAPYRGLGESSVSRLSYLLGLTDLSGGAQYDKKYGELVDTSSGVPKPVASLYSSDPAYRQAWDAAMAMHRGAGYNKGGGGNYTADSDTGWIDTVIRERLPGRDSFQDMEADSSYGSLLSKFSLADLNSDVVYNKGLQFGLDEGMKALDRRQLALGGFDSGAAIKAATKFANDYGETKAAGAQARFMGDKAFTLNSLLGTTNVGQRAVETDANTGMQMATAIGGAQMGAGNARAAGIVGGANAWSNALTGAGNAWNTYQQNEQTRRVLDGMGY